MTNEEAIQEIYNWVAKYGESAKFMLKPKGGYQALYGLKKEAIIKAVEALEKCIMAESGGYCWGCNCQKVSGEE